ncbi:DUF1176 domain-containing protein, partial [Salmonella enterica subsp. enterica serovar Montevideo]|nr:DUF1176 domain-containing protein [Salmonella enterica subsp. enterica serovar Montevideo]
GGYPYQSASFVPEDNALAVRRLHKQQVCHAVTVKITKYVIAAPPLSVPPAPALKGIAVINPTPVPLSEEERDDLLDYAAWRVNG